MIKPAFYITILLFMFVFGIQAQENLIPNGSFEEYNWCPNTTDGYYIETAKYWFLPTLGSADYFNSCSTEDDGFGNTIFSVPQNYIGYQSARTGSGYSGYYAALNSDNNNYYEYISVRLNNTLEENEVYHLSYYLSLSDSVYKSSNLTPQQFVNYSAAYFSSDSLVINNDLKINSKPQFISDPDVFLNDSLGWQKVEGYFISNGTENFMTIGYFCNLDEIRYNYKNSLTGNAVVAYYFVDDITLEKVDIEIPNIFTPNNDGINDKFKPNFQTSNSKITIFNRWGNIVFDSSVSNSFEWDGTSNMKMCLDGIYFYEFQFENIKKTGFIQLIR